MLLRGMVWVHTKLLSMLLAVLAICSGEAITSQDCVAESFGSPESVCTVNGILEDKGTDFAPACSWSPTVRLSPNSQRRHPHGLCWVSQSHRYIYMNIAKVASTTLKQIVGATNSGRARESRCNFDAETGSVLSFQSHLGRSEYSEPVSAAGYFTFAFVRDPSRRFLSGFRTVAKRGALGGAYGDSKRMSFVRVLHSERDQMQAFFTDVARNGGAWEEHTAPQAFYLSHPQSKIPLRFDFLGRVEQLNHDWRTLESRLKIDPIRGFPRRNPAERSDQVSDPISIQMLLGDREMMQNVCQLYAQDFTCLNYSLPAVCTPIVTPQKQSN